MPRVAAEDGEMKSLRKKWNFSSFTRPRVEVRVLRHLASPSALIFPSRWHMHAVAGGHNTCIAAKVVVR